MPYMKNDEQSASEQSKSSAIRLFFKKHQDLILQCYNWSVFLLTSVQGLAVLTTGILMLSTGLIIPGVASLLLGLLSCSASAFLSRRLINQCFEKPAKTKQNQADHEVGEGVTQRLDKEELNTDDLYQKPNGSGLSLFSANGNNSAPTAVEETSDYQPSYGYSNA